MSAISLKSITGITSITTPAGVDNQLTLHNNNTTEAVKLDSEGNLHFHNHLNITGISTAANFKTGTSNLHSTGLNIFDLDVDGHTNLDNVSIAGVTTFSTSPVVPNGGYYKGIINSGSQQKIVGGYISGSDTLRLGESMYLTTTGLGIGTVNPLRQLHVLGTGEVTRFQSTNSVSAIRLYSTASGYSEIGHTGDLYFGTGNGGEKVRIQGATGNVGIGTNNPQKQLQILGDSDTCIRVTSSAGGAASLQLGDTSDTVKGAITFLNSDNSLRIRGHNNADRIVITSGGTALFGTTASVNSLRAVFQGYSDGGENFQARIRFQSAQATNLITNSHIANLLFTNASGSEGARIDVKADSNWGTGSYPSRIEFSTTASGANSTTERLRITSTGKIIIGNSGTAYGNGAVQSFIAHTANAGTSGFNSIDTTSVAAGVGGEISFYGKFNTGAQDYAYLGHIRGIKENATAGNTACALTFHTRPTATAPSERLRITSGGRILGGNHLNDRGAILQIESSDHAMIGIHRNTNDHGAPAMNFSASRGTSAGSNTIVQSGDYLGLIRFSGADGSDLATGAMITGIVDGTPGSNDMPTRLGFWTSADGSQSPTERLRIDSSGNLWLKSSTNNQQPKLKIESYGEYGEIKADGNGSIIIDADPDFNANNSYIGFKVDGSMKARITSEGYVTMPNQPCFQAVVNGSHISAGSYVVFGSVDVNVGNAYNSSNGIFTAPVAGVYLFHISSIAFNNKSTVYRFYLRINNGNTGSGSDAHLRIDRSNNGYAYQYGPNASYTYYKAMNVNDTARVYFTPDDNTAQAYGGSDYFKFGGHLVG